MLMSEWEQINATALAQLCTDRCPESDTLEFKRSIERPEAVLKAVTAMANSNGGDLVFGLDEQDGRASVLAPLTGDSPDATIRRIAQILDGTEPRVHGLQFKHIDVEGGFAIIVRVPRSFDGPHSFRVNTGRRFTLRNGPGTSDMSFEQLRNAFDRTATLAQRASEHAANRLRMIATDQSPVRLQEGPLCVVQLVPIAALAGSKSVDVVALSRRGYERFIGPGWSSATPRLTLDGLLVHPGSLSKPTYGYALAYRSGVVETVRQIGDLIPLRPNAPAPSELIPVMRRPDVAVYFRKMIGLCGEHSRQCGFSGPAILSIAMLRVNKYQLGAQSVHLALEPAVADRPDLVLPELWVERVEDFPVDSVAQQSLDTLWQAFGFERCDAFDDAIRIGQ